MGTEDIIPFLGIMLVMLCVIFLVILGLLGVLGVLFDWILGVKRKPETTSTHSRTGGIVGDSGGGDGNGTAGDGGSSGDCGIGGDCGGGM